MQTRLLVVGVGQDSLGEDIAAQARIHPKFKDGEVVKADLFGEENADIRYMDIRKTASRHRVLDDVEPTHVCCTVGINTYVRDAVNLSRGDSFESVMTAAMLENIETNAVAVMSLAYAWLDIVQDHRQQGWAENEEYFDKYYGYHFAAVSSNSAHIARTNSAPYCMSKAALSMGMRCIAREAARRRDPVAFTTYEPGFLSGTQMSMEISGSTDEFQEARYHRIPSGLAIQPTDLSEAILNGMGSAWNLMNGACIRLDGGEQ